MNYTTADYLEQLEQDRQDLVDNLETQGIIGLTGNETFTELVHDILNIGESNPTSWTNNSNNLVNYTTVDYLEQLEQDRQDMISNLETKGITGLSGNETFTELIPEVLNIVIAPKVYGIKRAYNNNTGSTWERIEDSVGKVANATHDGTTVVNDFDNIYPWKDIKSYNYDTTNEEITAWYGDANFKFDGTNGEVLTKIPAFYYKRYTDDTYEYILISKDNIAGYTYSPEFSVGRYTSYYDGSKLHSYSGYSPETKRQRNSFRTLSQAVGTGFSQLDYHIFLLQMLYLVEYANYDSKTILGKGITDGRFKNTDKAQVAENNTNRIIVTNEVAGYFKIGQQISIGTTDLWADSPIGYNRTITSKEAYTNNNSYTAIYFDGTPINITTNNTIYTIKQKSGQCDNLGMKSGCFANDGISAVIYRGVENIYGNINCYFDGLTISDRYLYLCFNPASYSDETTTGDYHKLSYFSLGITGYTIRFGYDSSYPIAMFSYQISSSSTPVGSCDEYVGSNYNTSKIAYINGDWRMPKTGLFGIAFLANTTDAYMNIGSRLIKS